VTIDSIGGPVTVSTSAGQFATSGVAVTPGFAPGLLDHDESIPFGFFGFTISGAPPLTDVTITITVGNFPGQTLVGYEKCLDLVCAILKKPGDDARNVTLKEIRPGFGTTKLILTCTTDKNGVCTDPGAPVEQSSGGGGGSAGLPLLLPLGLMAWVRRRRKGGAALREGGVGLG